MLIQKYRLKKSKICNNCNKEDQGFEPWNATNVNSFQDYRHQPLGQSSNKSPQRTSKSKRFTLRWRLAS